MKNQIKSIIILLISFLTFLFSSCEKQELGAETKLATFIFPKSYDGVLYPLNPIPSVSPYSFTTFKRSANCPTFGYKDYAYFAVTVKDKNGDPVFATEELKDGGNGSEWKCDIQVPSSGSYTVHVEFADAARNDYFDEWYRANNIPGPYSTPVRRLFSGSTTFGSATNDHKIYLSLKGWDVAYYDACSN